MGGRGQLTLTQQVEQGVERGEGGTGAQGPGIISHKLCEGLGIPLIVFCSWHM